MLEELIDLVDVPRSDYVAMDIPALEERIRVLGQGRDAFKSEQMKAVAVLDAKLAEEKARQQVALLSDGERAALLQHLTAGSAPSQAAVGAVNADV